MRYPVMNVGRPSLRLGQTDINQTPTSWWSIPEYADVQYWKNLAQQTEGYPAYIHDPIVDKYVQVYNQYQGWGANFGGVPLTGSTFMPPPVATGAGSNPPPPAPPPVATGAGSNPPPPVATGFKPAPAQGPCPEGEVLISSGCVPIQQAPPESTWTPQPPPPPPSPPPTRTTGYLPNVATGYGPSTSSETTPTAMTPSLEDTGMALGRPGFMSQVRLAPQQRMSQAPFMGQVRLRSRS
jgi:hypothetical protein